MAKQITTCSTPTLLPSQYTNYVLKEMNKNKMNKLKNRLEFLKTHV